LPNITSIETVLVARQVCHDWNRALLPCVEANDAGPDQLPKPNEIYALTFRLARDQPSPFYASLSGAAEWKNNRNYPSSPDTVLGNLGRLYTTVHVLCQSTTIGIFRILYSEDDRFKDPASHNAFVIRCALLMNNSIHTIALQFYYAKSCTDANSNPFPTQGIPTIQDLWHATSLKKNIRNVSIYGDTKFLDKYWNDPDHLQPYEDWLYFPKLLECLPMLDKFECNMWSDESVELLLDFISIGQGARHMELRNITVGAVEFCQCLLGLLQVKPEPQMTILIECKGFYYSDVQETNVAAIWKELFSALDAECFQQVHMTFWNVPLSPIVQDALKKYPCFTVVTDFDHSEVPFL
jgi:hypothetical protein